MVRTRRVLASGVALTLAISGCEGLLLDGAAGPGGARGGTGTTPTPTVPRDDRPGHADAIDGVRRLTVLEHHNSVTALFGALDYTETLAPDTHEHLYDRVADSLTVSPAHVQGYAETAQRVARAAIDTEGALAPYLACDDATLPPRTTARSTTQRAGDLSCSYLANCYRPDEDLSFPNHKSNGDLPGAIAYAESVPAPGRYRITVVGHGMGAAEDEPSVIRFVHGELGEIGRITLTGSTNATRSFEWSAEHAGTQAMQIEWVSPLLEPRRRVRLSTITLEGPIAEVETSDAALRACAEGLVDTLGERAFRRPLEPDERARFLEVYDAGAESSFWDGVRMVIELALQSPQFLYVVERGEPVAGAPGRYRLDPYELATRLSFLAWQAPPDEALREDARSGALADPEVLRAHAIRLLSDSRARETVRRFYEQWLSLEEVALLTRPADLFPELTPALRDAMVEETFRFLDDATWESRLDLDAVLTADHTFADASLAALYGTTASGDALERVTLPPERRGLLMHAGLLAAHSQPNQSSPVKRGAFVIERFLCADLPPPPDGVVVQPPALDDGPAPRSTRERWAAHSADPACSGCHGLIDPVGFTFESFDPIGRFRSEEHGRPIDASGGLPLVGVEDGALEGAVELAHALAAAPETDVCAARQWLRFGLGRLERDVDAETLQRLTRALDEEGLRAMFVALVDTDAFRHRIVLDEIEEGEVRR